MVLVEVCSTKVTLAKVTNTVDFTDTYLHFDVEIEAAIRAGCSIALDYKKEDALI